MTITYTIRAQNPGGILDKASEFKPDTTHLNEMLDLVDIGKNILKINPGPPRSASGKGVFYSFLPFSTQVPGGGTALVTSTTGSFYLGDRKDTYMSSVTFAPYWNFKRRFGLPIRSNVWLKENKWVISSDIRMMVYPHYTWGLGKQFEDKDRTLVNYTYFRYYQQMMKRFEKGLFAGIGYHLDYRMNIRTNAGQPSLREYTGYNYGTGSNSVSSGVSLNLVYDTRNNFLNPWDGYYLSAQLRGNPTFLGNNNNWSSLFVDLRRYIRFNSTMHRQNMLALWTYYWNAFDNEVPYLDLPSIGWDDWNRSGRGLQQSRYRGKELFYTEAEYRRDILKNGFLGFVAFFNLNSVTGPNSHFLQTWNYGAGGGLRIKMNKRSATNIGINYGFSKDNKGINITLGEVF